jgi:hypothetical protein
MKPRDDNKKSLGLLFGVVLVIGLAAPGVAWGQNDSERPGSVLVFHRFVRGVVVVDGTVTPRTEIEISVLCPQFRTCNRNSITGDFERVFLRAHWVCSGFETVGGGQCREADFDLQTTVKGTIRLSPEPTLLGDAPVPDCGEGYLIVWVTDGSGQPIKFDGLIGDAVIRDSGDSAGGYNALAIQAAGSLAANPPALTDVDGDGNLDFNGAEYQRISGRISGSIRYPNTLTGAVRTELTLLTLDVRSNLPNNATYVPLNFYNEGEVLRSGATRFVCWARIPLNFIRSDLNQAFGTKGLLQSGQAVKEASFNGDVSGPVTLVGIVNTFEGPGVVNFAPALREYSYSLYHDSTTVPTTFEPFSR